MQDCFWLLLLLLLLPSAAAGPWLKQPCPLCLANASTPLVNPGTTATAPQVILVRTETSPEDVGGMHAAEGILTARGGMTSHAAVVARGWGKPCVCGLEKLEGELEGNDGPDSLEVSRDRGGSPWFSLHTNITHSRGLQSTTAPRRAAWTGTSCARATGSRSTARPGRSSGARCRSRRRR